MDANGREWTRMDANERELFSLVPLAADKLNS
jgi:hypothetical protein